MGRQGGETQAARGVRRLAEKHAETQQKIVQQGATKPLIALIPHGVQALDDYAAKIEAERAAARGAKCTAGSGPPPQRAEESPAHPTNRPPYSATLGGPPRFCTPSLRKPTRRARPPRINKPLLHFQIYIYIQ